MLARLSLLAVLILVPAISAAAAEEEVVVKKRIAVERADDGERRERVMNKIETVRIARMTDELELDSATAEKLFPAVRPFSERRAVATRARGDAGKVLKEELEKATPDAKILTAELDRFAAAQKDFNDASEEEYAVLKKVLEPVTLARYYQFQREFEHEVRGLLNEFRDGNPAKEKREKWEQRQKVWDRQNREDRQMEKGSHK